LAVKGLSKDGEIFKNAFLWSYSTPKQLVVNVF